MNVTSSVNGVPGVANWSSGAITIGATFVAVTVIVSGVGSQAGGSLSSQTASVKVVVPSSAGVNVG